MPTRNVSVISRLMYAALPGSANGLMVANTTIEIAAVGPDTKCRDEPNRAETTTGTIAVYEPNSGGRPAMVA